MSIHQDFANAIVDVCNAESRRLDSPQFEALTPTCSFGERLLILAELPMWAQRDINRTAGLGQWVA